MSSTPGTFELGSTTRDARLSIACLGACQVRLDGAPVTAFRSQKALALLVYLAVEAERPHRRERLAGLFWPEFGDQAARHSLRQALANLRLLLGDDGADGTDCPYLLVSRDAVQFNARSAHRLDVALFVMLRDTIERHPHRRLQACQSCLRRLEQAAALYRGDFLQQVFVSDSAAFEEWATIKREQLQQQALDALRQLAAAHAQHGRYEQARQAVWRQLELAPWSEDAHRHLMRLLCQQGQPTAALAQYELCRRALDEALAVEPSLETTRLYEEIRTSLSSDLQVPSIPLRPAARHSLPAPPTTLVGREAELAALGEVIEDASRRFVTLTGPGGIGKTCLALQAAHDQRDAFVDGVIFVSLAPLGDPGLVASTIAQALGIKADGDQPVLARLQAHLAGKQLLLLLDNFEHVISAAPVVADLLKAAPRLEVLVTSRTVLRLYGEQEFPVPPLVAPPVGVHDWATTLEVLAGYPAVQLFVQRARAVRPGFQLTSKNGPAVAAICARLDGLPLAIELAAARTKLFAPQALLARLDQSLAWLTGGPTDHPARQRTLRATVDWSYRLLESAEQTLFSRLAVFRGGRTLEAVDAVCNAADDLAIDPCDGVASLVDKSLLHQEEGPAGEPRFVMLETIHEYARERLEASADVEVLRQRHAAYFRQVAEAVDVEVMGVHHGAWMARLAADQDNLRAALRWVLERREEETALWLAHALGLCCEAAGQIPEARQWIEAALAAPQHGQAAVPDAGPASAVRWTTLCHAVHLARFAGDYGAAHRYAEEALAVSRVRADKRGIGIALWGLAMIASATGDVATARALHTEAISLQREIGDPVPLADSLNAAGWQAYLAGDEAHALALLEESLALFRHAGDTTPLIGFTLESLGHLLLDRDDHARAHALLVEALHLAQRHEVQSLLMWGVEGLACLAARVGSAWGAPEVGAQRAARLFGAAEALRETGAELFSPPEHRVHARNVAIARPHMDAEAWQAAWAEGRAMPLEQAIAYALQAES